MVLFITGPERMDGLAAVQRDDHQCRSLSLHVGKSYQRSVRRDSETFLSRLQDQLFLPAAGRDAPERFLQCGLIEQRSSVRRNADRCAAFNVRDMCLVGAVSINSPDVSVTGSVGREKN